jgi:hypothetical protein
MNEATTSAARFVSEEDPLFVVKRLVNGLT